MAEEFDVAACRKRSRREWTLMTRSRRRLLVTLVVVNLLLAAGVVLKGRAQASAFPCGSTSTWCACERSCEWCQWFCVDTGQPTEEYICREDGDCPLP